MKQNTSNSWNQKGVPYSQLAELIDKFPEGHEITENLKDLVSSLDDHAFSYDQIVIKDWTGNVLFEGDVNSKKVDRVLKANWCKCKT